MFGYPARLTKDRVGYVVTFRDIPEAHSAGRSKRQALEIAADALATAMEFYFEDRKEVPMPSKLRRGECGVMLPSSVSAKVLLLNMGRNLSAPVK